MVTQIDALPTPPSRQRPDTFSAEGDAFLAALPDFQEQTNALAIDVESIAADVVESENNAASSEEAAAESETKAEAAAATAYSSANATVYSGVATYNFPDVVVTTNGKTWICLGTGVTGVDPSAGISVDWQPTVIRILPSATPETANFVAAIDTLNLVDTTGGEVTASLPLSPEAGDIKSFRDYSGTFASNALTITTADTVIEGGDNFLTVDIDYISISLMYVDSTKGWILI